MDETHVAVGDVFRLGDAVIEVSQGRQPCWRLNLRFAVGDMALRVQRSGRTGWYYRVIEEGVVSPHDSLVLVDRRSPDWTLHRLWRLLAERRLATRAVEDWSARLSQKVVDD